MLEKEKLFFVDKDKLSDYELMYMRASYQTIVDRYFTNKILCNNLPKIDEELFYEIEIGEEMLYNDDEDYYIDIYQYYIVDISSYSLDALKNLLYGQNESNPIILAYSEMLDNYVLMVPHYGTSWDYVLTDVKLTFDINEVDVFL